MSDELIKVDTRIHGKRPQTRHLALINKIRQPYPDGNIYDTTVAVTPCGKVLKEFWEATQTSYHYADNGGRYSMPCRQCLRLEYESESAKDRSL